MGVQVCNPCEWSKQGPPGLGRDTTGAQHEAEQIPPTPPAPQIEIINPGGPPDYSLGNECNLTEDQIW